MLGFENLPHVIAGTIYLPKIFKFTIKNISLKCKKSPRIHCRILFDVYRCQKYFSDNRNK